MPSTQSTRKQDLKSQKGSKEGDLYEEILSLSLAMRCYELYEKGVPEFCEFTIGSEVKIGKYNKFDDVVCIYVDSINRQDKTKSLIFVQLKHKQDNKLINSGVLSTEADRAKEIKSWYGSMCDDFNLQQYFISYLSVRDELKNTSTKKLKRGEIKYCVLFTNNGLDSEELKEKGFRFKKEAPPDMIVNLFNLEESSSGTYYQFEKVSEGLLKVFEKSSDLDRLARELARYVVCEEYSKNGIMGIGGTALKFYHSWLAEHVIEKSDDVKSISTVEQDKDKKYREAWFRNSFLDSGEHSLSQLRTALFEAIRDIDESKKDEKDDGLKEILETAKWKVVPIFGESKKNIKTDLPREWTPITKSDIKDFLQCFVFIDNQPTAKVLETHYKSSMQCIVAENASLKQIQAQMDATGAEFRDCVNKVYQKHTKRRGGEKFFSCDSIRHFIKEKKQLVSVTFSVSALILMCKNEVMQYGKFNEVGKIVEIVDSFLKSDCKILCVITPATLLSSIKISQHFNSVKDYITENEPISVILDILNCAENRDCVLKAFELERINLLTIECRRAFKDRDFDFFDKLFDIAKRSSGKKIILIMQEEKCDILKRKFKTDFQDERLCVTENDSIVLKDFHPKENLLAKKILLFQGQKEKVSLSDITGINSWNPYAEKLFCVQGIIDGTTLVKILNNDEIEVGSKPSGTSSLEGAYTKMFEEINVKTLGNKLMSLERDSNTDDVYIISGIFGSSERDKKDNLVKYLVLGNENEEFKNRLEEIKIRLKIVSVNNLQIVDDQFKDENFQQLCHSYPEKRIFWICVKCENDAPKFILQEIYNPRFYLERKFKNVIIMKDLKEHLIKADLSETFIFHCGEDEPELCSSMEFNEREKEQFEENCKTGKIKLFTEKSDAEANFKKFSETVHLLEFEQKQLVWSDSRGSVKILQKYIDYERCETSLFEEDNLIRKIKDRKVMIFSDEPGMGKTTTVTKLYERGNESSSIIKSHWVIGIKLRDHLKAVRDLEFKKDHIYIVSVVEFLSKTDSKLNNNLAKNLLKIALDKRGNFKVKPLLLAFDGFDEVLDEEDRKKVVWLLQFIKNKTTAKLWITTRCHFKKLLEEELSTIAFEFVPLEDEKKRIYIAEYLQHRLYLSIGEEKYIELFDNNDKQSNEGVLHRYITRFLVKMKSIFRKDVARFIGTPLQLYLMLEVLVEDFKKAIENEEAKYPDFSDVGDNIWEVYQNFIDRKYGVYFQKLGIRERVRKREEEMHLDQYHKDFAKFKILELKPKKYLYAFLYKILLAGIVKSDTQFISKSISDTQFIHQTFGEFFAAKVFIHWIEKGKNKFSNTRKQEYLLKEVLKKPDYKLIRIFMNLQLQKLAGQAGKDELYESLKHYGDIAAKLLEEEKSPLIDDTGTSLHTAVKEGNKAIVCFLLNTLQGHPDELRKFLFTPGKYGFSEDTGSVRKGTALHLACFIGDVETVKILLDAAAGIPGDTLQEFLKCLTGKEGNALHVAVRYRGNVQILKELIKRANNKLDLILSPKSALSLACNLEKEEVVDFLLQEFKHDKYYLQQLLLHNGEDGNALCRARSTTTVEKLISAAKSMNDNAETLKNLLLPEEGELPLNEAVYLEETGTFEKLLDVAKEIGDDNRTLKRLLLYERYGGSALSVVVKFGRVDIIKLLLKTAADLGTEMFVELFGAVNEEGKNAVHLMVETYETECFKTIFEILEEDKYPDIRQTVNEMLVEVPLKSRLYVDIGNFINAIRRNDIIEVKDILSKTKNASYSPKECLRILLLAEDLLYESKLHIACKRGYSEIIQELISCAKEIGDDNYTLKQLLLNETSGKSALHAASENGVVDIIKLLLKTASDLGIEFLKKFVIAVDEEGKNAIQVMVEHGYDEKISASFEMLEEDILAEVKKMLDNVPQESCHRSIQSKLITAIDYADIETVKNILSKAKNSNENLLSKDLLGRMTLYNAHVSGNSEIIKEICSYAMNLDDEGAILNELLKKLYWREARFKKPGQRNTNITKQVVESLISEARNNNRGRAANILEEINNRYAEMEELSSEESPLHTSYSFSSSSSED